MKFPAIKKILKTAAVSMIFLGMTVVPAISADFVHVNSDGVNLRSGPDTTYEKLYELPLGYPLKVLSKKGNWIKVSDFEDDRGWVYASLVSENSYVIVKVKEANVRSGAGTNYNKVGSVVQEVILKKVDTAGDWIKVEHPQLTGWLSKKLVWP